MSMLDIGAWVAGTALGMAIETALFALVAAVPIASLVVIGVVGQSLAATILTGVAILGALEALIMSIIKAGFI